VRLKRNPSCFKTPSSAKKRSKHDTLRTSDLRRQSTSRRTLHMLSQNISLCEESVAEIPAKKGAVIYLSDVKQPATVAFRKPKEVLSYHAIPREEPRTECIVRKDSPLRQSGGVQPTPSRPVHASSSDTPLRHMSPTRVDSIAKLKDYLGENPFRYTYQVAPNRLLILEEVSPNQGRKSD